MQHFDTLIHFQGTARHIFTMHKRCAEGSSLRSCKEEHLIFPLRADAIPLAKFRAAAKRDWNCSLTLAILFIRLVRPEGEGTDIAIYIYVRIYVCLYT